MLKNLLICALAVTGFILSNSIGALAKREIGNYVTSNEIQTSEQAKTERKYFKRRKKRLKRWNFDVDVSVCPFLSFAGCCVMPRSHWHLRSLRTLRIGLP